MGRFGLTMRKTASFIDSTGCHYTGKVSFAINTERLSNSGNYRDYIFEVLPDPKDVLWEKEHEYFQFSTLEGSIYPEFPLNRVPYLHCSIKHKEIVEIRGAGLLLGIKTKRNNLDISNNLVNNKLLNVTSADNVIRLAPPLIITKKEVDEAVKIINQTLEDLND